METVFSGVGRGEVGGAGVGSAAGGRVPVEKRKKNGRRVRRNFR
jgi:hypothetical protein